MPTDYGDRVGAKKPTTGAGQGRAVQAAAAVEAKRRAALPSLRYGSADTEERNRVFQPAQDAYVASGGAPIDYTYGSWLDEQNGKGRALNDLSQSQPAYTTPGSSGGGGNGSGGSGTSASDAAAKAAIQSLFGIYNRPADTSLTDQLGALTGQAQQTGATAISQLKAQLGGEQNPYNEQYATPQVASNPLEQYMKQGGVSTDGLEQFRQLLGASSQQSVAADQMVADRARQSWNSSQQGALQDANTSEAAFQQSLANNNAAYGAQVKQQQQKAKDDLMMQILQLAVSSGVNLGDLGVTF